MAGFASAALADEPKGPVVVELFTSQACSSCPPADALLAELAERGDVIALALHVDYWDYLGWRDMFGSPANTRRQRDYAEGASSRIVFTPQMVIDGSVSVVGSRREEVFDEIALAATHRKPARVAIRRDGAWLDISVDVAGEGGRDEVLEVAMFVLEPPATVKPTRGENAGRRILYRNAVRDWHVLGEWRGAPARWRAPAPQDAEAVAVIAQMANGREIVGAAMLALRADADLISHSDARDPVRLGPSAPATQ
ncbi:MAG: DUF1223 domain-containing protein [Rubrimonas sp.]